MLSVMAGPDLRAPLSLGDPGSDFARVAERDPRGLRVAVAPDFGGRLPVEGEVVDAISHAGDILERMGAHVEQDMPDLTDAEEVFNIRRAWQFYSNLGRLVDEHPDQVKESIRWNVEKGRSLTVDDLTRAMVRGQELYQRVVAFFERFDVLLVPAAQVLPFDGSLEHPTEINGQPLDTYLAWMRACSDITPTGCPAMSVPAGFSADGLPIGVQMVAAPRADAALLGIAKTFERATGYGQRRPDIVARTP